MKEYEVIYADGSGVDHFQIEPKYEPLFTELFDGRVFDIEPAKSAIAAIDEAKLRIQSDPDKYRALIGNGSLRGCRVLLDKMRAILADMSGATFSGLVEPDVPTSS